MSTRLIQTPVVAAALRDPDVVAIRYKDESLTYGELEAWSNALANLLRRHGCRRGDRVALMMPKTPAAIVSMLGTLKADCVYVPVDTSSPAARVARILESCEPRVILYSGTGKALLAALREAGSVAPGTIAACMDSAAVGVPGDAFSWEEVRTGDASARVWENGPEDVAHILFTSGSTGVPKGVMITHANANTFLDWAEEYFGISAGDRISSHPPLHFDLSTFDVHGTLRAGATLFIVPPELNLLPHKMADFIRSNELTQWFSVPSVLNYMTKFDAVRPGDFPALRRLLWCGEALPTPTLIYLMRRVPHASYTNLYGPTEATIASSYFQVPECPADDRAPISIGAACGGEYLKVLDEHLQPVPSGEIGDLYIGGEGLSPGYWRDEAKTATVFVIDPTDGQRIYKTGDLARFGPDGLLYLIGRADTQIKSRGYRIELGEIESALHTIPGVEESAIVAVDSEDFDGARIACAYVPAPGTELTPQVLRTRLTQMLPPYMIPSRWERFERLPLNGSGKVDRRALREHFQSAAAV